MSPPAVAREGMSQEDLRHLERARRIAHEGWGKIQPNPLVGCVLVRDGVVVGEGYHAAFGGPHAEIVALEAAGGRAEGATAYVSLEPCNHQGKTPPCARALLGAGIRRVVYGAAEPSLLAGGGAAALRADGVEVVGPVWDEATAQAENPAFFHVARRGTPFVALKLATSLDGRIAAGPGVRTRITGVEAEREVHRLRAGFEGVMVGAGTVRADDPRLTVRLAEQGRIPPRRIVLDSGASLGTDAALFEGVSEAPVHIFTGDRVPEAEIERLEGAGAHVHPVPGGPGGLDLAQVLAVCWGLGIQSILCEGGATLAGALLAEERVQRLYWLVAPRALGSSGIPTLGGRPESVDWGRFHPVGDPVRLGRDTLITLDRRG